MAQENTQNNSENQNSDTVSGNVALPAQNANESTPTQQESSASDTAQSNVEESIPSVQNSSEDIFKVPPGWGAENDEELIAAYKKQYDDFQLKEENSKLYESDGDTLTSAPPLPEDQNTTQTNSDGASTVRNQTDSVASKYKFTSFHTFVEESYEGGFWSLVTFSTKTEIGVTKKEPPPKAEGEETNTNDGQQTPPPPPLPPPPQQAGGGGQQPAGGAQQPAGGEQQPAGGEQQPAGGEQQPAGGEQQPAGGGQQPAGGGQQPAENSNTEKQVDVYDNMVIVDVDHPKDAEHYAYNIEQKFDFEDEMTEEQCLSARDNLLKFKLKNIYSLNKYFDNENLFSITYEDLVEYNKNLKDLFKDYEEEKIRHDKNYKNLVYSPELNFFDMYKNYQILFSAVRKFLYESLSRPLYLCRTNYDFIETDDWALDDDIPSYKLAEERLSKCIINFSKCDTCALAGYYMKFFKTKDQYCFIIDYPEIVSVQFPLNEKEKESLSHIFTQENMPEYVTVYRQFLMGDPKEYYDAIRLPYARYLLINCYNISNSLFYLDGTEEVDKQNKGDSKHPIDFKHFLSFFIRPTFTLLYDLEEGGTKKYENPLKNAEEVSEVRDKAKNEREKNVNPKKLEKKNTGEDLFKKDLNSSLGIGALSSMSQKDLIGFIGKYNLNVLKDLAIECLTNFGLEAPNLPNFNIPRYNYNFDLKISDPSGGMYKQFVNNLTNVSFGVFVDVLKKYFTVQECNDLKNFFNKQTYKNFFKDLKSSVSTYYKEYALRILEDFEKLSNIIQKNLCNPNVFLLTLTTSEGEVTPQDVSDILKGKNNPTALNIFTDKVNKFNYYFNCEQLQPEDVSVVFSFIGRHFPADIVNGYYVEDEPEEQEKFHETKVHCENAFGMYLEWLRENGLSEDVLECLRNQTLEEKNDILSGMMNFSVNNVVTDSGMMIAEDPSLKESMLAVFNGVVGSYFDSFGSNLYLLYENMRSKFIKEDLQSFQSGLEDSFVHMLDDDNTLEQLTGESVNEGEKEEQKEKVKKNFKKFLNNENNNFIFNTYSVTDGLTNGKPFSDIVLSLKNSELFFHASIGKYEFRTKLGNGEPFRMIFEFPEENYDLCPISMYRNAERSETDNPTYRVILDKGAMSTLDADWRSINPFHRHAFRDYVLRGVERKYDGEEARNYFEHFTSSQIASAIQEQMMKFVFQESLEFNPLLTDYKVNNSFKYGLDIFLFYLTKIIDNNIKENKECLFSRNEFFEKFFRSVQESLKKNNEYEVEKNLKHILFEIKKRLSSMFFNIGIAPTLFFGGKLDNYLLGKYLISLYPRLFSEFEEPILVPPDIRKEYKAYWELGYKMGEITEHEESMVRDMIKRGSRFKTSNVVGKLKKEYDSYSTMDADGIETHGGAYCYEEAKTYMQSEILDVQNAFVKMLNGGKNINLIRYFIRSLRFRHFDGRIESIRAFDLREYYNNYKIYEGKFELFVETYFTTSTNRIRNFELPVFSMFYKKEQDYYTCIEEGLERISIFDVLDETNRNIPDFYFSVSFGKYSNYPLTQSNPILEWTVPIVRVLIKRSELIAYVQKISGWKTFESSKKWDIIKDYMYSKLFSESEFDLIFSAFLNLDRIYRFYQIFLYEVMRETTDIDKMFDIKFRIKRDQEPCCDGSGEGGGKYEDPEILSDTFGILRALKAVSPIQRMALQFAKETPKLILKAFVETTDPNIQIARRIVDYSKTKMDGKKLDIRFVSLAMLLPSNVWPPPIGIGPPITPYGLMYLAFGDKLNTFLEDKKNVQKELEKQLSEQQDYDKFLKFLMDMYKYAYIDKKFEDARNVREIGDGCIK